MPPDWAKQPAGSDRPAEAEAPAGPDAPPAPEAAAEPAEGVEPPAGDLSDDLHERVSQVVDQLRRDTERAEEAVDADPTTVLPRPRPPAEEEVAAAPSAPSAPAAEEAAGAERKPVAATAAPAAEPDFWAPHRP